MRKLIVFNFISLDGYFVDGAGGMNWAHNNDPEFKAFAEENAKGGGELLFGRMTYDLMASYWPTPAAMKNDPVVAERMNNLPKVVFSRTMDRATWNNTRLIKSNMVAEVHKMKMETGLGMVIMGSGNIISQLVTEGLIDEYQLVAVPVVLGNGRTMFEGVKKMIHLRLTKSRVFKSGYVLHCYEPVA
jgi:dihydrofolate reductase